MQDIQERVAYLEGLMAGLEVQDSSKEGKVLHEVIQVLGDIADNLVEMQTTQTELENYMETMNEDLADLEDDFYETDELSEDAEDYIEVQCPECHDLVYFDADLIEDGDLVEVTCPNCDAVVFTNDESLDMTRDNGFNLTSESEDI